MNSLIVDGSRTDSLEITLPPGLIEKCEFHYKSILGVAEVASFRISITDVTGKEVGYSQFMLKKNIFKFQVEGIEPDYTVMGRVENLTSDSVSSISGLGTYLFKRSLELSIDLKRKCKEKGLISDDSTVGLVIDVLSRRISWTERRCIQFKIPKLRGDHHWGKLI